MDPITAALVAALAAAANTGVSNIASSAIKDIYQGLLEKLRGDSLTKAKREYEESSRNLSSPFEIRRKDLLIILTQLQTKVIFYVTNKTLLFTAVFGKIEPIAASSH
jgi:hypothetical protein